MTLKGDAKFKGKLTFTLKNDLRNLVNFHASSQKSENLHFDWLLLSSAYKGLEEKLQKSYVSKHWRVIQSLKKNWLLVPKNNIRNFEHFNVSSGKSENLHFDVLLLPKVYYVWAKKSTEGLYVITLANKANFEDKLPCALKNDMKDLTNFDPTLESLKICTLIGYFWPKYIMFGLNRSYA